MYNPADEKIEAADVTFHEPVALESSGFVPRIGSAAIQTYGTIPTAKWPPSGGTHA